MQLVTRTHPQIRAFEEQARKLGSHIAEAALGRHCYCYMFSEAVDPENQIFEIRPARRKEVSVPDWLLVDDPSARDAIGALVEMSRDSFPSLIADFRICPDVEKPGMAFVYDYHGVRSHSRPVNYFRPSTASTLRTRCYGVGCA